MARPKDPDSPYRVSEHHSNGHVYASSQPFVRDPKGNLVRRRTSWGVVIDSRFIPNKRFLYATQEEREKLIFPDHWDLSAIKTDTPTFNTTFDLSSVSDYHDRFFGTTWLLGQIADKLHIKEDLLETFDGNEEMVNDILTIAMFPYITTYNLDRLEKWQQLEKYPSTRVLSPPNITFLSQAITEKHRLKFLKARGARLQPEELMAVDSTTKTGWTDTLIHVRWGKNKEGLPLEVTVEVVIYTLSGHQPVYYRIFPGNIPDSKTINVILADLKEAGFKNVIFITDRGYESISNLDEYILQNQKAIMCVKSGSSFSLDTLKSLKEYSFVPEGFELDPEKELYYRQFDITHDVILEDGKAKPADRLKLNLYFDPVRRSAVLKKIDLSQTGALQELNELIAEKTAIPDPEHLQKKYPYLKLSFETIPESNWVEPHGKLIPIPEHKILKAYTRDDEAIANARKSAGFFALLTLGVDYSAMEALEQYSLRDEQEKYFSQMKTQMLCDRQRNSSEDGKAGRAFIQFIGLMMSSYLRHAWKTTELHDLFSSTLDILDEMRSVRCIEYPEQKKVKLTPFVGKQLDICRILGFDLPQESQEEIILPSKKKRGRPKGSKNKKKSLP